MPNDTTFNRLDKAIDRRFFSRKQRRYLAVLSGGLCAICGQKLSPAMHADHVIAWSCGGKTLLGNGQALCALCNLKKGNR
jgi:HNH endonuclease.